MIVLLLAHAALLSRLVLTGELPRSRAVLRVLTELRLIAPPKPPPPAPRKEALPPRIAVTRPSAVTPVEAPALPSPSPDSSPTDSSPTAAAPSPAEATGGGTRSTIAPLNLALPARSGSKLESIDVNPAISDPRANTPRLRFSEKFAIAAGEYDCIVVERGPEGGLERYPGQRKTVPNASAAWGSGGEVKVCVKKPGSAPIR